ncbi:chemotaxis protein CheW [Noviherbaspirillum denitrificans]|uniref:Chemotaxis protein CheW n=1 Tax=Noviherbaspirillum denitrificans TaxID=1968433 RepID=A0A254TDR6_9BURK|nr:chemotaxis protein CheW [Noviherbaspirillum denitrificans]OWW19452.1 chemotaxis protein CheW [Noviherbaspirillum denitrificans]
MQETAPLAIDTFLPYMRDVVRCEQSLRELNLMWRMIEASAKMNCPTEARTILPTMAATRAGFNRLEQELVSSLVREKVGNVLDEIGTKAQYVIDIVVRNLFERTADVGFLATDRELCAFVAGLHDDADAARLRLRAYRSKYTVYDEIILLDTQGNVLVQIDEATPLEGSTDPLIAETLASASYVETFRHTDLRPGKKQALVYSRRMLHPDTGSPVGVLCLCFHFEEEMAGIFRSHRDAEERSNMLLLDGDNRVIASADERWIPPGAVVPVNRDASPRLMVYGGREYLVRTFSAEGYQGYMGPPGWQGQVMIPVDVAFRGGAGTDALSTLDGTVADGLLSHARSFCPPLFEIMTAADTIRRVVWNGQVMTAGQRGELLKLKTILDQISETGNRSNELFSQSIRDLYETVLASSLRDAEFVTHLLVDLLDRNLYERSDDCRWWALTPELRAALASGESDFETIEGINAILDYINRLYTVYTRIFVYDADGRIIASTNPEEDGDSVVGTFVDGDTLAAVRGLRHEQHYHVTPFEPTPLYGQRPTYVYHAAIRDPGRDASVVGGIGIVFDAEPEFAAMLRGALGDKQNISALFIDRNGRIISSTDPSRPVGAQLDIDPELLRLENGTSASRIVLHDGHYAIMGVSVSNGYREFKVSDGYKEDVIAVVYQLFGEVREQAGTRIADAVIENGAAAEGGREYATFFIDGMLFAMPAAAVLEALPASEISPVSMGGRAERIGVLAQQRVGESSNFVWVFDLRHLMRGKPSDIGSASQVVVVRHNGQDIGLLVDELHGVPEFGDAQIVPTPFAASPDGLLVKQVIRANEGRLLIQALDIAQLFACLKDPSLPTVLNLSDVQRLTGYRDAAALMGEAA